MAPGGFHDHFAAFLAAGPKVVLGDFQEHVLKQFWPQAQSGSTRLPAGRFKAFWPHAQKCVQEASRSLFSSISHGLAQPRRGGVLCVLRSHSGRPRRRFLDRGRVLCVLWSHSNRPRSRFLERGCVFCFLRSHSDHPRSRFLDRGRVLCILRPHSDRPRSRFLDRGRVLRP